MRSSRGNLLPAWVGVLVVGAAAMCIGLVLHGERIRHPLAITILALLAVAAERERIRLNPAIEVSVASILFVFAAVVYGPLSAVVVGATGMLADLFRRDGAQRILRWTTWTAIRVIVAGAVGLAAVAVEGATKAGFWAVFAAVTAAYVVESVADITLTPVAIAIRGSGSWTETVSTMGLALLASVPLQAPMVAVLAYSYVTISPWSVALFAIPAVAAQRLHLLYRRQRETVEALGLANARLESANLSFATALVATLDARDRYTAGHSAVVAVYARDIAKRLGCSEQEQELAHVCGLVHDVGKIGLPAGLLEKPGALSLEERRMMEQHSVIGERILKNVDDYSEIASVVRHHHERLDGLGYPDGLRGDEIPLLSRVLAVADAYNAMTSDRPYRDAMPSRVARLRLAQAVEGQFDTAVVAAFEAILAGASEDYRLGGGAEFQPFQSDVPDRAVGQLLKTAAAAVGSG
jgi:putative nucleotidyltransferase with HDIG domain